MTSAATSGRSFAADPIVDAGGPLPEPWPNQLVHCVVDENVGLPDAATLSFRDPNHELLTETRITIGTLLKVSVSTLDKQAQELLFTGEVTALELDSDSTGSFTIVRAQSLAHRLFRGRKVAAFQNTALPAIVDKVLVGTGISRGRIEAPKIIYKHLAQANVSDWEFLQSLAQEHGATVRVDDKGRLDFVKPALASKAPPPSTTSAQSAFVLEYGENLMALRAVLTAADQVDAVEVRGWNVDTKQPVIAKHPLRPSTTVRPGFKNTSNFGKTTLLVADTPYGNNAEANAAARSLAASMSAGLGEVEAVVEGNPLLRAGVPVTLANVGAAFSGRYTATAVHHVLDPNTGYRTTVLVSASPDRSLAGLTTGANAPARGPRIPGVVTGIVTDIKETGRAQRGWVKLKFPWLDDKNYQTDWVRTVQLGGQGGGVFGPDVDDEVLVGFEHGCLDKPYVLGGLYNGKDVPSPHTLPLVDRGGKVNRRSLVSRKGHRLELIDGMIGPPGVRIASGNDRLEIRVDERHNKIDVTVFGPGGKGALSSMSLTPQGITIDAGKGNLTLSGGTVSIDATGKVGINSAGLATLQGRMVRIN
ncbi:VgrG-related protein [Actinophytocola sp.]|uniref:VgrG-related protein n=1 Tax=Actinophytocola sp. TaxID=1872138 RepID=UPI002ED4B233